MFRRAGWLALICLTMGAFTGCYTQLKAPETPGSEVSSRPRVEPVPVSQPPRISIYLGSSGFPLSFYSDPWNRPFYGYNSWTDSYYDPYENQWVSRVILSNGPWFWANAPGYIGYGSYGWGPYSGAIFRPRRHWHSDGTVLWSSADTTRAVTPRPDLRNLGFDTGIPSARAIRGGTQAVSSQPPRPAGETQLPQTAPPPSPPPSPPVQSASQVQAPPPPPSDSSGNTGQTQQEKREEKRKKEHRNEGMN